MSFLRWMELLVSFLVRTEELINVDAKSDVKVCLKERKSSSFLWDTQCSRPSSCKSDCKPRNRVARDETRMLRRWSCCQNVETIEKLGESRWDLVAGENRAELLAVGCRISVQKRTPGFRRWTGERVLSG